MTCSANAWKPIATITRASAATTGPPGTGGINGASAWNAAGGLGDLLGLFGQSNPLAQAGKTLGQFQKAVDDLLDIQGLTAEEAGQLIMKAREHWFAAGHG